MNPITYFFNTWLWSKFPSWFQQQDTYINPAGKGLLQRYLCNFGLEIDENIKSYIDNFMELFSPLTCPPALLPSLGFILGLPIGIDNTQETYIKVLQYAIQLYKVKGTILSYQMLFNLLGMEIVIIEDIPGKPLTYDQDPILTYDQDPVLTYDTGCSPCSGYSIAYNSASDPLNVAAIDSAMLQVAQTILPFIQPINATFDGFIKRLNITEVMPITITETSSANNFLPPTGEFGNDFDNVEEFD